MEYVKIYNRCDQIYYMCSQQSSRKYAELGSGVRCLPETAERYMWRFKCYVQYMCILGYTCKCAIHSRSLVHWKFKFICCLGEMYSTDVLTLVDEKALTNSKEHNICSPAKSCARSRVQDFFRLLVVNLLQI